MKYIKCSTRNKEHILLRKRKLSDGRESLYLDIHHNGKRKRQFLGMYILPGKTQKINLQNKMTLEIAEKIRAKKQLDIQLSRFEVLHEYKPQTLFLDYYRKLCTKKFGTDNQSKWGSCKTVLRLLEQYATETTTFQEIDGHWIEGFKSFLMSYKKKCTCHIVNSNRGTMLSQSTIKGYYQRLCVCIKEAFADRIIAVNPLVDVKSMPMSETKREHLSWEEIQALNNTPCKYPDLKRAFLFSCFTGLRKSDIEKLCWGEVREMDGITRIVFRQKKTRTQEYLDISENASYYLGKRGTDEEKVFPHFKLSLNVSKELQRWLKRAGINRYITFHCARHTFAVLMLYFGVDIYTVSKLLGHKGITVTQIYAKIVDKKKQEAAGLFPNLEINKLSVRKRNPTAIEKENPIIESKWAEISEESNKAKKGK